MIARITDDVNLMEIAESMAKAVLSIPALIPQFTAMARLALGLVAVYRKDTAAALEHYSALKPFPSITLFICQH